MLKPVDSLAELFARQAKDWSLRIGASVAHATVAARAASAVSRAVRDGHTCAMITTLCEECGTSEAEAREALLRSGVVADAGASANTPMVVDASGRIYLRRYFALEKALAHKLAELAEAVVPAPSDACAARLDALFPAEADAGANWQRVAAAMALVSKLAVISGGPGTGKTTTVVTILACILADTPDARIALAAPTGKAAARMTEAVRQRSGALPVSLQSLMPKESHTIHRLLGYHPARRSFRYGAENPLPFDVVVIDEASMIDLSLATRLFAAVQGTTRVILLGDKDQLAAVESGAVFAEISRGSGWSARRLAQLEPLCGVPAQVLAQSASGIQAPLSDAVVWLHRNYRFAETSRIGRLATLIRHGAVAGAREWVLQGNDEELEWHDQSATASELPDGIANGYAAYLQALRDSPTDCLALTRAFAAFRVLCAVRDGPHGVERLNAFFEERVWALFGRPGNGSEWYPGRPVMVLRNDYALKLFNGDIGITLPDERGNLQVWFPEPDGLFRPIAAARLAACETAFAMTVHKAQGSEFDRVALVVPAADSPVLTRELLYTGLTRARQRAVIWATMGSIERGVSRKVDRQSGLAES